MEQITQKEALDEKALDFPLREVVATRNEYPMGRRGWVFEEAYLRGFDKREAACGGEANVGSGEWWWRSGWKDSVAKLRS